MPDAAGNFKGISVPPLPWHTIPAAEVTKLRLALDPTATIELTPEQRTAIDEAKMDR